MEEYVRIPKHLIVDLLRAENGLSAALINLPPTVRPVVDRCAAKIRQIAATAGLATGECSSAHEQVPVSVLANQGMSLSFEVVVKLKKIGVTDIFHFQFCIVYFNPFSSLKLVLFPTYERQISFFMMREPEVLVFTVPSFNVHRDTNSL